MLRECHASYGRGLYGRGLEEVGQRVLNLAYLDWDFIYKNMGEEDLRAVYKLNQK